MELPITDALAAHPYFRQCLALSESYENKEVAGPDVLVEAGELMEAVDQDSSATAQQRRDAKALLNFVAPNKSWDEDTVSKYFQSAILRYYDRRTSDEKSFEEAIIRFTEMVGRQNAGAGAGGAGSSSASAVAGAMGAGARRARAALAGAAGVAKAKDESPEDAEKRKARNKKKAAQKKKKEKERKDAGLPPKPKEPKEDPKLYEDID